MCHSVPLIGCFLEVVSKPSIGFKSKAGQDGQPEDPAVGGTNILRIGRFDLIPPLARILSDRGGFETTSNHIKNIRGQNEATG